MSASAPDLAEGVAAAGHDPGSLAPVLDWVASRLGPVRELRGLRQGDPEPRWWIYNAELARPLERWFVQRWPAASGASVSGTEALQRVLGECVERYVALSSHRLARLEVATPSEEDAALFERFPRCAADEPCAATLRAIPRGTPLSLVPMQRLSDGRPARVPAGFVHLSFRRPESEPRLLPVQISTGMAFHPELHRALWSALCEVAERDAVMLAWWSRRPARPLALEGAALPAVLAERLARIARAGLRAHLFDVTTDFRVPTVLCLLEGRARPYWIAGASCRRDPAEACAKALDETVLVREAQHRCGATRPVTSFERFEWMSDLLDHANLYAEWRDSPALRWLLDAEPRVAWPEFRDTDWWPAPGSLEELAQLAARLERMGLTPLWCDLGSEDVRALGSCVRVVVPEMVPLAVGNAARWLATPRLRAQLAPGADWNPYPQPLP
jgi:ribosomal protein S12 methylthiotransferase accessory factor